MTYVIIVCSHGNWFSNVLVLITLPSRIRVAYSLYMDSTLGPVLITRMFKHLTSVKYHVCMDNNYLILCHLSKYRINHHQLSTL